MPPGITLGIRIEVLLVVGAIFWYLRDMHKLSTLRSAAGAILAYLLIFLFLSAPLLLQGISYVLGVEVVIRSELALRNFFILIACAEVVLLCALTNRHAFFAIVRDVRLSRLLHYWLMLGMGVMLALRTGFITITDDTMFYPLLLLGAVACAWIFSVITNNMADMAIDAVSNPERPLLGGKVALDTYQKAAWVALGLSLALSFAVGYSTLFLIAVFIGNYFIYSMPPLRLKRVPYFSKFAIVCNSLALVMVGFIVFNGGSMNTLLYTLYEGRLALLLSLGLPFTASAKLLAVVFVAVLLLAMNFIDLKDYEGDKQEGVNTLPVLLGLRMSKFIIGGAFFFLYAAVGVLLGGSAFFAAGLLGVLQFYFITQKEYREEYVFAVYLSSLIAVFLYTML